MQTYLITGGAGFIGSNLTAKLIITTKIICIDNFDPFYAKGLKEKNLAQFIKHKNFSFIEGDILDRNAIENIFTANKIDAVIHLAAKAGVRPSIADPIGYFNVNVQGTINLLEEMKKRSVSKMLFASSSSVYGDNRKTPFSETDNVDNPISPYAASKKAGELICSTYNKLYGIDIFALRFFTVYGPSQRPEMAIANFANRILNNEPITLFDGSGSTSRDYTYIDDITEGITNCLGKINGFEIINLGESQVVKLIDLVRLLEKHLGKKADIVFGERQPGDVEITFADISKAKEMIGYNPKTKIDEGINKYCQWLNNK
ncbi:MAG: GDP-mannose 4,6-dehydratase [Bacteroidota bacterium]